MTGDIDVDLHETKNMKKRKRLHDHTLLLLELHPLDTHLRKRRRALGSLTPRQRLLMYVPIHVLRSTLRGSRRGYTPRTLTRRTSRRPHITRRVRSQGWRRAPSRAGSGVDERVPMLVRELPLRWCLGGSTGTLLDLWTHRVSRWLFCDGWEDWGGCSARSVSVVTGRRVLPDDLNYLSAVLQRQSWGTTLAFRALLGLRAFTYKFGFRDVIVLLPRERLGRWLGQGSQTLDSIRVTMIGSLVIGIGHVVTSPIQALGSPIGTTSELPRYPWYRRRRLPCSNPWQILHSANLSWQPSLQT